MLSKPIELLQFPKVLLHIGQRGHLPWHSRYKTTAGTFFLFLIELLTILSVPSAKNKRSYIRLLCLIFQDGDLCNVDVTVYHRGFHGDLNETFFVGNVSEKHKNLVKVTYEALQKAIDIVKPGERYREIGNVIQKHVQTHGYSVVKSYCGHGIHRLFHTAPNVPHYASEIIF